MAFTHATAMQAAAKSHAVRKGPSELKQATELQAAAYKLAKDICDAPSLSEKSSREKAILLPQLVRAWDTTTNRIRILRGRPMPGSKRPARDEPKMGRQRAAKVPRNLPPVLFSGGTGHSDVTPA